MTAAKPPSPPLDAAAERDQSLSEPSNRLCYNKSPHRAHDWSRDGWAYLCKGVRITTPAKLVEALRNAFWDWRDEWTDRRGTSGDYDDRVFGVTAKRRWWLAAAVDKLPGQCWADLADYGLGKSLVPWNPQRGRCEQSARDCGTCYCGKYATAAAAAQGAPGGYRPRVIVPLLEGSSIEEMGPTGPATEANAGYASTGGGHDA